ncbi:hypothetical protein Vadar_032315 [Vaccinium darrowii]|uniref:Uncharacterized protein n=1 Tax=Vaccinium darrowii TaxID=229202 RepID=A0ACB7Z855_9ERIC|nr:hypothetical protein Vadar_032315 [Vaccinium darrowii]
MFSQSLIDETRSQLYTQKNRRGAIIRQSRADISQLLLSGHYDTAIARVEQLHHNECVLSAYTQIGQFCYTVHTNIREISSRKRLPYQVVEAVSSLVFAASRCGELPELHQIRLLIKKRFGSEFERTNVKLLPGHFVNSQIKYNLGNKNLSDDEKVEIISEIAKECNISLKPDEISAEKPVTPRESLNSNGNDQSQDSKLKTTWKIGSKFSTFGPGSWFYSCYGKNNLSERRDSSTKTEGAYGKLDGSRHKKKVKGQTMLRKLGFSRRGRTYSGRRLLRNNSSSSNVHPKLPDYDKLVATFTEKKEEHKKSNPDERTRRKWMPWF